MILAGLILRLIEHVICQSCWDSSALLATPEKKPKLIAINFGFPSLSEGLL